MYSYIVVLAWGMLLGCLMARHRNKLDREELQRRIYALTARLHIAESDARHHHEKATAALNAFYQCHEREGKQA